MSKGTATARKFELPEIFWKDEEDSEPEPTPEAIATIYVKRLPKNGDEKQADHIDTCTVDDLPNRGALREKYGPGLYKLTGRAIGGRILARVVHSVGSLQAAAPPAPAPVAAPATGGDSTAMMRFVMDLCKQMVEQARDSNATIVQAVTGLAGARIVDQQDLFATIMKSRAAGGGGNGGIDAYEKGMKKVMEFMDAAREAEIANGGAAGDGGDDTVERMKAFTDMLKAVQEMKNTPGQGNGSASH